MSWSLLLQQRPAGLVFLIWMAFEIYGKWPYSCCFVTVVSTTSRMLRAILDQSWKVANIKYRKENNEKVVQNE